MKQKQKSKNYVILGLFLFGITLFLWNCTLEENLVEQEKIDLSNVKTVSFKDAVAHFNAKKEKIQQKNAYARSSEDALEVTPDWNTLEYNEIAYTNAQLTTADSEINRNGEYSSELYFINVNNHIRNVIFTLWKDEIDSDGNVINGRIFFNDLEGTFIDGYIIEDGIFTKRYVIQAQTQQASFLPLFFFQSLTTEGDCWNTDTLGEFDGGVLGEVVITASGGGSGSGNSNGPGHSGSYNWYYTSGPGSGGYGGYVNGATSWNSMPTGGGGGSSLSSGQITSAAAAILMASPVDPDDEGNCPEGYVLNSTTGKCDPICNTGGKIYNTTTKECECPDNTVEDKDGNCVAKPCEGDPVKGGLEIAPQKGKSGTLGAMFGNSTTGGCKRYGATDCTTPRNKKHDGIDIKSDYGDPIYAMYNGFIYSTKYDSDGAGYYTRVQSTINGETIIISYFHLQKENRVLATSSPLTYVKAGDIIGYQGDSGNLKNAISGGTVDSHMHIEVRKHNGSSSWSYSHFDLVAPRDYFATSIDSTGVSQANTNCN